MRNGWHIQLKCCGCGGGSVQMLLLALFLNCFVRKLHVSFLGLAETTKKHVLERACCLQDVPSCGFSFRRRFPLEPPLQNLG
jgi:hypothetical protein